MNDNKRWALTAGAVIGVIGIATAAVLMTGGSRQDADERQQEVADRGRTVMPFDLEQTTHRFTPTETGGIQDVVADQPDDAEQIDLIRTHLQQEAAAFSHGDFGDPAQIHGADMPGLTALESGYENFEVEFEERADGATLTYKTEDPALVTALHDWFDAQLSDHGGHAETGH